MDQQGFLKDKEFDVSSLAREMALKESDTPVTHQ